MLAVGVGTVWWSVGKGSRQMNPFFELVGLSTDILDDLALILVLLTACFAHIRRYCFIGDGPKEVKFLSSGLEQPLELPQSQMSYSAMLWSNLSIILYFATFALCAGKQRVPVPLPCSCSGRTNAQHCPAARAQRELPEPD